MRYRSVYARFEDSRARASLDGESMSRMDSMSRLMDNAAERAAAAATATFGLCVCVRSSGEDTLPPPLLPPLPPKVASTEAWRRSKRFSRLERPSCSVPEACNVRMSSWSESSSILSL